MKRRERVIVLKRVGGFFYTIGIKSCCVQEVYLQKCIEKMYNADLFFFFSSGQKEKGCVLIVFIKVTIFVTMCFNQVTI